MLYEFEKIQPYDLKAGHLKMGECNPSGNEINVNNLYLTENGKPFIPVMGEIHISRTRRRDWKDRILKMKAAGINIISSYLFWICHEPEEGRFDFTGENDIAEFIRLCQENGLYFSLRVGPQITAECRNGGYPDWIWSSKIPLRTNNEQYLYYVRRWYEKIYEQVEPYLFKNGGNIIIIQFENELTRNPEHLMKLKEMSLEIGLTAPIYTATGWNLVGGAMLPEDELLPMWGGYAAKPWTRNIDKIKLSGHYVFSHTRNSCEIGNDLIKTDNHEVHLPLDRYPYTYCELGTGIPNSKHRRPVITEKDNYAMALVKIGSGCNLPGYYMFCGGKNQLPDGYTLNASDYDDASANLYPIINYDFQSPVGEYGNIKDTYRMLKLLNYFCNDFGSELAEMQSFIQKDEVSYDNANSLRYAVRCNGDKGYIFVNTYAHLLQMNGTKNVQFKLEDGNIVPKKPIDIMPDTSFFFPYGISYGKLRANSITAQPILKCEDTYFFLSVPGIEPVYDFEGYEPITAKIGINNGFKINGITFITLSLEEALSLYRIDGKVYICDNADLISENGKISAAGYGEYIYKAYENGKFVTYKTGMVAPLAKVSFNQIENADIDTKYFYEMQKQLDEENKCYRLANRQMKYYDLSVDSENGYLYIDYQGDSAQLYVDGELFDDHFYNGIQWIVPAEKLYNKKVIMVVAEYLNDIYTDIKPHDSCKLEKISVKAR